MALRFKFSYCALAWLVSIPCAWAAAPSRTYTYNTGATIDPAQVGGNEDNIFSYLQAGVDTYAAGSVNAAAIADDAVGASEIAADAVGASEIAAGAVGASEIATSGVDLGTADVTGTLAIANGGTGATTLNNLITLSTHTTGNYVADVADGSGIDVTGTAAEGWTATVNLLYTDTLAGNPSMNADETRFSTDGTGGGLIFEGAADTVEGLLVWNPTTSDRTLTLPDATDTIVGRATTDTLTNKTITASGLITADANVDVKNGATTAGVLSLYEDSDDGSNLASFQVPALAANTVYTLPADDGDASEFLQTNGSGTLDWVAVSGGATTGMVSFTRDTSTATGTQAVTGVGFQPLACWFVSVQDDSSEMSVGMQDDLTSGGGSILDKNPTSAGTYATSGFRGNPIFDWESTGNYYAGYISTYGADGFTISWTRTGTPTGTITVYALCIK